MIRFIIAAALLTAAAFVAANAHAEDERSHVSGLLGANIGMTQKLDSATGAGAR
jgi:hypothetical protein